MLLLLKNSDPSCPVSLQYQCTLYLHFALYNSYYCCFSFLVNPEVIPGRYVTVFYIFHYHLYTNMFSNVVFSCVLGWQCWWPSSWCSSTFTTLFRLIRQRYNLLSRKHATLSVIKKQHRTLIKSTQNGFIRYCELKNNIWKDAQTFRFLVPNPSLSHSTAILPPSLLYPSLSSLCITCINWMLGNGIANKK